MSVAHSRRLLIASGLGLVLPALLAAALSGCTNAASQGEVGNRPALSDAPWFGVMLPPGLTDGSPVIGTRPAAPAVVPDGEGRFTELAGAAIRRDLETIVSFSHESRRSREVGEAMLWGRITGFPSGNRATEWAAEQFRAAGVANVALQTFTQDEGAALTLPLSWEVRLLGHPAFGPQSEDVVLESAMPLSGVDLPDGLTAPVVFVGTANPAELAQLDVRGKVAVQKVIPQGHTVFTRGPVGERAQDLLARGAVAVLNIVDLPGNLRSRDMGCGGGLCFNVGGRDGRFLESVFAAAADAGSLDQLQVRLRVDTERFSGLSGQNAVAIVPGTGAGHIVVNAHADAWFDGAGDNGDGLAVMIALARHFARPANRPARSLVFVASAGHHSSGLSGPRQFLGMNKELVADTQLVINIEHIAQRHITPARSEHDDGYGEWVMDSHESPIVAGMTHDSPLLEEVLQRGIARYGTNFVAGPNPTSSGEGGAYRQAGLMVFTTIQGPPLYHTTGEILEVVSVPGLERMARFMAFFLKEAGNAPAGRLNP